MLKSQSEQNIRIEAIKRRSEGEQKEEKDTHQKDTEKKINSKPGHQKNSKRPRIMVKVNDDDDDNEEFSMSPLYCSDLNECVDAILDNKDNFHEQLNKLQDRLNIGDKDIQNHVVRHKLHNKKVARN